MNGERVVVHYSGHVQGVGFRFTTRRIAVRHPVNGFVQNLPDGRVLLVAEGPRDELNRFLEEIQSFLGRHIDQASVQFEPMKGEFLAFEIRH
jgi:acylphosphatase